MLPHRFIRLTKREREVLHLLTVTCLSVPAIAKFLGISSYTAKAHKRSICRKIEAKNTAELCKWYWTVDQYQPGL